MATREENLKKINAELEQLTDEELDNVAGGNCIESADDSRFLNSLNGSTDRYGATRIFFSMGFTGIDAEISDAWAKVGVEAEIDSGKLLNCGEKNIYKINGKQVTQEEARKHAMQVTGHHMERKDWDW